MTTSTIRHSIVVCLAAATLAACAEPADPPGTPTASEPTLKVGVRQDAPPFSSVNPESNKVEGFEVDLANAMLEHLDYSEIEFVTVTGETRIPMLQQGNVDLILGTLSITEERKDVVNFSRPYFPAALGLLVAEDSEIKDPLDVDGQTACQPKGTLGADIIKEQITSEYGPVNFDVTELRTYPECVLAMTQGRVDFIGTDYGTLEGLERQSKGVVLLDHFIPGFPYGIGIAKGKDDLTNEVNEALLEVFRDGTWTDIHKKWVGDGIPNDWPPKE